MSEGEAEKKKIAELRFGIGEAEANLKVIDEKLEAISKKADKLDLGKNLKVDTTKIKSSYQNLDEMVNKYGKNVTNTYLKGVNIAEKAEKDKEVAAYKLMLKQEEYNKRIQTNTKSMYDKIGEYAKTYLIYQGFNMLKRAAGEVVQEMVDVEQQMVAIDRVMNVTGMDIDAFRDKLIQLAYDYGNSFDNVADISLRLAQAGIKSENNLKLTEKTLLALNTAELNATQATDDMVAVMSQWNLITDDATQTAKEYGDIIDKVNKVADNFPTTSADILDALKKTSSAFNIAGASINETIASIVAAEKASQRGGKAIGTALSNITQQLKDEGRMTIAESLGINFFSDEAKTQYKSVIEIFQQLSDKMQQLKQDGKESSVEMQNLLSVFTVFRRNIGASLLGEMAGEESTYAKALKTTTDAIGYSMDENAKYMRTAKAAQEQFNATLLQLKTEIWDNKVENVYRDLLKNGTDFIKWLSELSKDMKLLPSIISVITLAFSLFGKKIDANSLKKYTISLKEMKSALDLYNNTVAKGTMTSKQFENVVGKDIPKAVTNYTKGLNNVQASMSGLITKTVLQTAKQLALNLVVAATEAALSFGLSLAIQAVVTGIMGWIHATENAGEAIGQMNDKISEGSNNLSEYSDKFKQLRKELNDSNLTQEEYNSKKAELRDLEKELIEKYGDEAKGLALVTGEIDKQARAIQDLGKADYTKYIQENQKSINQLAKTFENDTRKELFLGFNQYGQQAGENLKQYLQNIQNITTEVSSAGGKSYLYVDAKGTIEEITDAYREMYNKIKEYEAQAEGKNKEFASHALEVVSQNINKLEEKYSESIDEYKEYLNNKLKYDNDYSIVYGKILDARAKVSEAITKKDPEALKKAKEELNNVYKEAIEQAGQDESVSRGMTNLLEEQINNANEQIEKDEIGLKIGVQGDKIFDDIQEILNKMGDISLDNLKDAFETGEITENMQDLKNVLDENGISVEQLIRFFEYLGFKLGETSNKVVSAGDTLSGLTTKIQKLDGELSTVYSAMQQLDSQGYITASTLQNLINNDLLKYFDITSGKLSINAQRLLDLAEAERVAAINSLEQAQAEDINNLALGDNEKLSKLAKTAIEQLGNNVETTGEQMSTSTAQANLYAAGLKNINDAASGQLGEGVDLEIFKRQANAIISAYQGIAANIGASIKGAIYTPQKATSDAAEYSAKKAQQEAERAAEEAAKKAEEIYKNSLSSFKDYMTEFERLEKRWVTKQKDLGLLNTDDYMYITEQRIKRYQEYLRAVKDASWLKDEDRLELEKKYTEGIEDLQVEYLEYVKDKLDEEIKAYEEANEKKIDLIKEEADARINALRTTEKETDRIREKEEYQRKREEHLNDISYWEQRTGREAQEALLEARKNLEELDREWNEKQEDWSLDDQIKAIEEQRDAEIKAIEDAQQSEIDAMKAVYDAKVQMFTESGQIIYENSVIQSKNLFNAYKSNFIDPVNNELTKLNQSLSTTTTQTSAEANTGSTAAQQYETYTIKSGDTLTKIARQYGTSIEKILEANPYVTNRNLIYTGKTLQIPKFHEGGIYGGAEEGLAILKRGEMVFKPEWSAGINRMIKYLDNVRTGNTTNISNGPSISVSGDLVRIEASVRNQNDIDALGRKVEKILKDKFNIKK